MNFCVSASVPEGSPQKSNGTKFYQLFIFLRFKVRDWVMQRVYELLRSWWLEGIEEKTVEKTKDNRTAANASKKNCGI